MLLQPAAHKFRSAVRSGNLGDADRLLVELRREVELAWAGAGAEERQSMAADVFELLDWAKLTVLVRRSHMQRKLVEIRREGAYHSSPGSRGRGQIEFVG